MSCVASAALVVAAGCASKPRPVAMSPAAIPEPLVSALLDARGSPARPSPHFSIGTLPPGYPAALVPAGHARIVGGMTTGHEMVAVFADSTQRLAAVMEQVFEQHGYTRPKQTPGAGFSPGSGAYASFCGDSGVVFVEPLTGANRTFARVTYRLQGPGSCQMFQGQHAAGILVFPELEPPADVHVMGSHGSTNSDGVISTAQVTGANLNAAAVVAHYGAQLVAAGWTAAAPAISERVAAEYFEAKSASGGWWEGVLMASGSKTALTISLSMQPRSQR
jgi:hypothetical protein